MYGQDLERADLPVSILSVISSNEARSIRFLIPEEQAIIVICVVFIIFDFFYLFT
jgi:hypothetical protein